MSRKHKKETTKNPVENRKNENSLPNQPNLDQCIVYCGTIVFHWGNKHTHTCDLCCHSLFSVSLIWVPIKCKPHIHIMCRIISGGQNSVWSYTSPKAPHTLVIRFSFWLTVVEQFICVYWLICVIYTMIRYPFEFFIMRTGIHKEKHGANNIQHGKLLYRRRCRNFVLSLSLSLVMTCRLLTSANLFTESQF